ncbi:MAG: response regulator [Candidatus Sericytochromatia bacterium]
MSFLNILMADDNADDRFLTKEAFYEAKINYKMDFVENGEELIDFLNRNNKYSHLKNEVLPNLILLDLNMPKKDGREALKEIKSNENLKKIPVVILTTSKAEEDITKTYSLGANSFISKPISFDEFVDVVKVFAKYWSEVSELPY